jgi:hypothetical protein
LKRRRRHHTNILLRQPQPLGMLQRTAQSRTDIKQRAAAGGSSSNSIATDAMRGRCFRMDGYRNRDSVLIIFFTYAPAWCPMVYRDVLMVMMTTAFRDENSDVENL